VIFAQIAEETKISSANRDLYGLSLSFKLLKKQEIYQQSINNEIIKPQSVKQQNT